MTEILNKIKTHIKQINDESNQDANFECKICGVQSTYEDTMIDHFFHKHVKLEIS